MRQPRLRTTAPRLLSASAESLAKAGTSRLTRPLVAATASVNVVSLLPRPPPSLSLSAAPLCDQFGREKPTPLVRAEVRAGHRAATQKCCRTHCPLFTPLRLHCTTSTSLSASTKRCLTSPKNAKEEEEEELKALVLACLPRAPLFAKVAQSQMLVQYYESTQYLWGPISDGTTALQGGNDEEKKDEAAKPSPQPRQQRVSSSSSSSSTASPSASAEHKNQSNTAQRSSANTSARKPRRVIHHENRLHRIRTAYGSFKGMLLAMAGERLSSMKAGDVEGEEDGKAAEEKVYRGGGRYGIYLSCDLTFVTVASSVREAGMTFKEAYLPLTSSDVLFIQNTVEKAAQAFTDDAKKPQQQLKSAGARASSLPISSSRLPEVESAEVNYEDIVVEESGVVSPEDYCYPILSSKRRLTQAEQLAQRRSHCLSQALNLRSGKTEELLNDLYLPYFGHDFIPPPPPSLPFTEAVITPSGTTTTAEAGVDASRASNRMPSTQHRKASAAVAPAVPSANTFTPQQIGTLLPTYFVPMDALLAQLPPGYTAAHVRAIFSETGAVETVQLGNNLFVRFHGGRRGDGFSAVVSQRQQERFDAVEQEQSEFADKGSSTDGRNNADYHESYATAEQQLRRYITAYKPDPYLFYAFTPCFVRPFQWVGLYDVVQHAPAAVQARLCPLQQQLTLLYFAQQQQHVQFTPQNGGALALCFPPTRALRPETTPLPRVLAEVAALLTNRGVVYVADLETDATPPLSDYAKRHIIAYFGTLRRFLFQHAATFRLSVFRSLLTACEESAQKQKEAEQQSGDAAAAAPSSNEAVSLSPPPLPVSLPRPGAGFASTAQPFYYGDAASVAEATLQGGVQDTSREDAQLDAEGFPRWLLSRDLAVQLEDEAKLQEHNRDSIEAQLEALQGTHSKIKTRKLRRRLAAMANPNSPFSDPVVLLDNILRYLPPKGHVSLKALLAELPMSMRDFLPNDPIGLFRNAPDKVQLFEYRRKNHLRVMRPGLPLPDGRLRRAYTDEELLHLIAAQLLPGQAKAASTLYGGLPYGGRETVRLRHRHLVNFLETYPQFFLVMYQDTKKDLKHLARISLLQPPPAPQTWTAEDNAVLTELTSEETEAVTKADRAILLSSMSAELRQTLEQQKNE